MSNTFNTLYGKTCRKAVFAALLAAGLLAGAKADPLIFDSQGNAVFGVTHETAGTYYDEFLFSVDGDINYSASGSAVVGYSFFNNAYSANYMITGLQIFSNNSDSSRTYLQTTRYWGDANFFHPVNRLTPGNYGFIVTGRTVHPGEGGSFAGNFNITPVPEPATYGMLLAGMTVLAFAARTRKT